MTPAAEPNVAEALAQATSALVAAGIGNARREARVLLSIALAAEPLSLLSAPERRLTAEEAAALAEALRRRVAGEPASRIRGRREFWSLDFAIAPGVLDPRPETELLVELALDHAAFFGAGPISILDLGTGSGCILLSLLHELPAAFGVGVDRSRAALTTARGNAMRLGLAGRSAWICGEWLRPVTGRFDLIVANPPYIPAGQVATLERGVRNHDPAEALDGGPDGLAPYRLIVPKLPAFLRPSGGAFLEVGAGQAERVAAIGRVCGLKALISRDLAGIPRAVRLLT